MLSDLTVADLTPEEDAAREDTLQVILTAIESGACLLSPENTFDSSAPAAGSEQPTAGSTT